MDILNTVKEEYSPKNNSLLKRKFTQTDNSKEFIEIDDDSDSDDDGIYNAQNPPKIATITIEGKGTLVIYENDPKFQILNKVYDDTMRELNGDDLFLNMLSSNLDLDVISLSDSTDPEEYNEKEKVVAKNQYDIKEIPQSTQNNNKVDIKKEDTSEIILGEEQMALINLIVDQNKSVFFTGSAGSGKSVVLKEIIARLRQKYPEKDSVAVTASTGLAALNIEGRTYHSHFGIGLGTESAKDIFETLSKNKDKKKKWTCCKVIIIDEISMVENMMITKLSKIAQLFHNNEKPFGGIQVIFCGDFFQLPPVITDFSTFKQAFGELTTEDYNKYKRARYAFMSPEWGKALDHEVTLTKVYRQRTDPEFVKILNEVRIGEVSDEADLQFKVLNRELDVLNGVEAANLYPTRNEAIAHNNYRLKELKGKPIVYECVKGGSLKGTPQFDKICSSFLAPDQIKLKIGCQVMLIKNQNDKLVNGSLGKIIDFVTQDDVMMFHIEKKLPKGCYGMLEKDPYYNFLTMKNVDHIGDQFAKYPVIKFISPNNNPDDAILSIVLPEMFEFLEHRTQKKLVYKSQLPLILAWALSVHKSQGQTYSYVKINLEKTFEVGQAYVALSRVTDRKGLQVIGWHSSKIKANPQVVEYCKHIKPINQISNDKEDENEITNNHKETRKLNIAPGQIIIQNNKKMVSLGGGSFTNLSDFDSDSDSD